MSSQGQKKKEIRLQKSFYSAVCRSAPILALGKRAAAIPQPLAKVDELADVSWRRSVPTHGRLPQLVVVGQEGRRNPAGGGPPMVAADASW